MFNNHSNYDNYNNCDGDNDEGDYHNHHGFSVIIIRSSLWILASHEAVFSRVCKNS